MSKWINHDRTWGMRQVGAGWSPLVARFYDYLEQLCEADRPEIRQIKEKFGGLRIYYQWHAHPNRGVYLLSAATVHKTKLRSIMEATDHLVGELEHQSMRVCEQCGAPGSIQCLNYWYLCLCEACFVSIKLRDGRVVDAY
jgi:hypothetical protein